MEKPGFKASKPSPAPVLATPEKSHSSYDDMEALNN